MSKRSRIPMPGRRMENRSRSRKEREPASPLRKLLRRGPIPLAVLLTGTALSAGLLALSIMLLVLRLQSLPASSSVQLTQIYDASGELLDSFRSGQSRETVPLTRISPYVIEATLAIEDHRFYKHGGFDLKGMARAAIVNLESGRARQGASTITQQLARNLYLTHERTWARKLKEAAYTAKLEMNYSKNEILSMYLNGIYYGHGAYGIQKAAGMYFGKNASQLTLAESAMLAGIPKGPKYYSPYMDMDNAVHRQRLILKAMQEGGYITPAQAEQARGEKLALKPLKPRRHWRGSSLLPRLCAAGRCGRARSGRGTDRGGRCPHLYDS